MKSWFFPKAQEQLPVIAPMGNRLDTGSESWGYVFVWAQGEIKRLRELNDSSVHDSSKTAFIRGQIKGLKNLVELPDKKGKQEKRRIEPPLDDEDF